MARTERGFAMSAQKIRTKRKNDITFCSYFDHLKSMAENSFKWDGWPESLDPLYLEECLFKYGLVAVFKDPVVGVVALPAMPAGGFDLYGLPRQVRAFSDRTGFSILLKYSPVPELSDCILIHNTGRDLNSARFKGTLGMYAERLAEMKRTEDVNIFAQRTPLAMVVPEGQVETYTNLLDRYNNFGQVVFGYKGLDVDAVKSIHTDAPFIADKVDELFIKTWNEAIGFLGISNLSVYKKERVNTDEVARSMGGSLMSRNIRQAPRERAVELINKKYGLNLKVTFSEELFDSELFGDNAGNITGYNRPGSAESGENLEQEQEGGNE